MTSRPHPKVIRFLGLLAALGLGFVVSGGAGQKAPLREAPLRYPILSHADWWQAQYGPSKRVWLDAFGEDYRNGNSGPACAVMVINYKKRARISSDLGSFSNPLFPKIWTDLRWKFCRANAGKGYPGGFADDDQVEVSGPELAEVLGNEDVPVLLKTEKSELAPGRMALAIGRYSLVVCRVDPSVFFPDENPGLGRWIVVYGADDSSVYFHDPGRPEGKAKKGARTDFLAALRNAAGGADPVWLECAVMIGNFDDGWHADSRSRMFVDYYKGVAAEIGFPFDNGGGFFVHTVGSCVVQDFLKPAVDPAAAKKSTSLLFLNQTLNRIFWVKDAFFEKYFAIWGFEKLGPPVSESYPVPEGRRQDFEKGALTWNGKEVAVKITSGE